MLRLALLLAASLWAATDKGLVGSWASADGAAYELKADGTGTSEGEAITWSSKVGVLTVAYADGATDKMSYRLKGDALSVTLEGETMMMTRVGAKKPAAKASKAPSGGGKLQSLLLSSAWCTFSYSKVSGTSKESRVVFSPDGRWSSGARRETYSSGDYGTVSGQADSADGGQWKTEGDRLFMSAAGQPMSELAISLSQNSNGSPIVTVNGTEYYLCR